MMLSNSFAGRDEVMKRLGYDPSDSLAPESVRAYVAEDGGLTECQVDKFGIDMPVFDDTIDSINRVSKDLAARLGEDS